MRTLLAILFFVIPIFSYSQNATNKLTTEQLDVNLYLMEASVDISKGSSLILGGGLLGIAGAAYATTEPEGTARNVVLGASILGAVLSTIGVYKIGRGGRKMNRSYKRLNDLHF